MEPLYYVSKGNDMRYVTAIMISMLLGGCASTMSGLDGGSQFSCKAPDGVTCTSLSGVYANAVANNLPTLQKTEKHRNGEKPSYWRQTIVGRVPTSGEPIRAQPKILRIWIAPWEDSEGDLHDQSYIYVVADPGRWMIEHTQKRVADRYRPTFIRAEAGQGAQKPANPSTQSTDGLVFQGTQAYGQGVTPQSSDGGQE